MFAVDVTWYFLFEILVWFKLVRIVIFGMCLYFNFAKEFGLIFSLIYRQAWCNFSVLFFSLMRSYHSQAMTLSFSHYRYYLFCVIFHSYSIIVNFPCPQLSFHLHYHPWETSWSLVLLTNINKITYIYICQYEMDYLINMVTAYLCTRKSIYIRHVSLYKNQSSSVLFCFWDGL